MTDFQMDRNIIVYVLQIEFFQIKGDLHIYGVTAFIEESLIMREFKHPNVLRLIGISVHNDTPCAILPLMSNGDLKSYMRQHGTVRRSLLTKYINVNLCQDK